MASIVMYTLAQHPCALGNFSFQQYCPMDHVSTVVLNDQLFTMLCLDQVLEFGRALGT